MDVNPLIKRGESSKLSTTVDMLSTEILRMAFSISLRGP